MQKVRKRADQWRRLLFRPQSTHAYNPRPGGKPHGALRPILKEVAHGS